MFVPKETYLMDAELEKIGESLSSISDSLSKISYVLDRAFRVERKWHVAFLPLPSCSKKP